MNYLNFICVSHYNMHPQTETLREPFSNLHYGRTLQYNMRKKIVDGKDLQFRGGSVRWWVGFDCNDMIVFIFTFLAPKTRRKGFYCESRQEIDSIYEFHLYFQLYLHKMMNKMSSIIVCRISTNFLFKSGVICRQKGDRICLQRVVSTE